MNFIDIIVVALIALYAVIGFWKGFIVQLFHIAGIFCAFYFNTPVSLFISEKLSSEPEPERYVLLLTGIAAFFLIFAVFFIAGKIVSKSFDLVLTSLPNRAAGIIFGGIKGFLVVTVLFLIIRSIGNGDEFLRKYVTPDKTTDEIINKGMDLAEGLRNDDDNKDKIEFFNKNIPDSTAYKEDKNTKIYSRLGYGAYKISTMMDPFVNNVKSMVKR